MYLYLYGVGAYYICTEFVPGIFSVSLAGNLPYFIWPLFALASVKITSFLWGGFPNSCSVQMLENHHLHSIKWCIHKAQNINCKQISDSSGLLDIKMSEYVMQVTRNYGIGTLTNPLFVVLQDDD